MNITEAPKFGNGGGLSHITICGELPAETPTPTPTVPADTPTPTPTTPGETPTSSPTDPAHTPTPTTPGEKHSPTPTVPGKRPTPTATEAVVTALPSTGSGDNGSTGGMLALLLIAGGAVIATGAWLARRPAER